MSEIPTTVDPTTTTPDTGDITEADLATEANTQDYDPEFAKKSLRVLALQHASTITSHEAPVDVLLNNAVAIEDWLSTGKIPE